MNVQLVASDAFCSWVPNKHILSLQELTSYVLTFVCSKLRIETHGILFYTQQFPKAKLRFHPPWKLKYSFVLMEEMLDLWLNYYLNNSKKGWWSNHMWLVSTISQYCTSCFGMPCQCTQCFALKNMAWNDIAQDDLRQTCHARTKVTYNNWSNGDMTWHDMTWHGHEHEHEHEHDFLFRGSDLYSKELCFKGQRITIKCSWFTSVPWLKETSQRGADWMRTATCVSMFYVLISCSWRFCHLVILPLIPCYLNMMTHSLMLNMLMLNYSVAMMVI